MARHNSHTLEYDQYIQTPEWRMRSRAAINRAGHRCRICNRHQSEVPLQAHHRTYERLCHELPDDLTVLCKDCHDLFHQHRRIAAPPYRPTTAAQMAYSLSSGNGAATVTAARPKPPASGFSSSRTGPTTQDRWLGFAVVSGIIVAVLLLVSVVSNLTDDPPPIAEPTRQPPTPSVQQKSSDSGPAVVAAGDADTATPTRSLAATRTPRPTPRRAVGPSAVPRQTSASVTTELFCTVIEDTVPRTGPSAQYPPARPFAQGEDVLVTGYTDSCTAGGETWYRLAGGRWLPRSLLDCPPVSALRRLDISCTLPPTLAPW